MTAESLPRSERIRRRAEFERIYASGSRVSARFMTLFVMANGSPSPRLGVAATRKLGGAVDRNRAKRLAREIFRRHKPSTGQDVVVVPRREMLDASFSSLEADFQDALQRPRGASGPRREFTGRGRRRPAPASRV